VPSLSNGTGPWTIHFSDPSLGQFTAYAVEAVATPTGGFIYTTPVNMVANFGTTLGYQGTGTANHYGFQQDNLNLSVVAYSGDSGTPGTAYIIIQQSPFTGSTSVSVAAGSVGSMTVSPAGPGTGIG
jgi:hypothetical protein